MQENLTYFPTTIKVPMIRKPFPCSFCKPSTFHKLACQRLLFGLINCSEVVSKEVASWWSQMSLNGTPSTLLFEPIFRSLSSTQIGSLNHKKKSLPYVSAVYTVVGQSSTKKSSGKELRCDIWVMRQFSFLLGHCALTGRYVLQNAVHCDFSSCTTCGESGFSFSNSWLPCIKM